MIQKFVRIKMRDRTSVVLTLEQAEQILQSTQQLIMLYDENGKWNGQSINKAEIISTDRDYDEERIYNRHKLLNLPVIETNDDGIEVKQLLKDYKPQFLNEKH